MPTPLHLNDDEMSVLMSLAGPIDQQRRPQFLQEVAAELECANFMLSPSSRGSSQGIKSRRCWRLRWPRSTTRL